MKDSMNKSHRLFEFSIIAGILAFMLFTNIVFSQESVTKINYTGFIDRFENNMAVILLEEREEEIILPKTILPSNTQENTHLKIELVPVTPRIMSKNN